MLRTAAATAVLTLALTASAQAKSFTITLTESRHDARPSSGYIINSWKVTGAPFGAHNMTSWGPRDAEDDAVVIFEGAKGAKDSYQGYVNTHKRILETTRTSQTTKFSGSGKIEAGTGKWKDAFGSWTISGTLHCVVGGCSGKITLKGNVSFGGSHPKPAHPVPQVK